VSGHDAFKQGALPILADAKAALSVLRKAALAAAWGLVRRTRPK
jgi:hypothetical protein